MRRGALRDRRFLAGIACGIALVFLSRAFINYSTIPDRLVSPLLTANSNETADAIVVLGGGVIADCVPNLNSMRRTVLGATLYRQRRAPIMLIAGGMAGGKCPVAQAMGQLAADLGVPLDRLVLEQESQSTMENGAKAAPLLKARGIRTVLLVTDRLHMRRASNVFSELGFTVRAASVPIYEGHPDNVSMLGAGFREIAALAYYRLRFGAVRQARPGTVTSEPSTDASVDGARQRQEPLVTSVRHPQGPVVVLGASYAGSWPLTSLAGVAVVNAGVAGQQTDALAARFTTDVVAANPRAVLLWGYINDVFANPRDAAVETRIRNTFAAMIDSAIDAGIEPVLVTEVTLPGPAGWIATARSALGELMGKISYQDQVNQRVITMNAWLRETAQRRRLLLLDFQAILADDDGRRRREFTTADGSHISPSGYEALTRYATPKLVDRFGLGSRRGPD